MNAARYIPGLESVATVKCGACSDNVFHGVTSRGIKITVNVTVPTSFGQYYIDRIEEGVLYVERIGAPRYLFGKQRVQPHVFTCKARKHE